MKLEEIAAQYLSERDCSTGYESNLLRAARVAGDAGISSGSLTRAGVNQLLKKLSTAKSKIFAHNFRRELLTIWRYAYEEGLVQTPPDRIAKINPVSPPVKAWSLEELTRLSRCADQDDSACGGLANPLVSEWLPLWIGIGYETAMRFTDIYTLTAESIRGNWVMTTAGKTGKALTRPVSARTEKLIRATLDHSPDGSLFTHRLTRRRAFVVWRKFLDRHGFTGSSKFLRRSCATMLENRQPGSASAYLQHSSPSLVYKHYIDQTLSRHWEGPPAIG
jgi:integrase